VRTSTHVLVAPNGEFWFGTDNLVRDVYSRVVHGSRVSLIIRRSARVLALPARGRGRSWPERRGDVRELLDGRLLVVADGIVIAQHAAPPGFALVARRARRAEHDRSDALRPTRPRSHSPQEARSGGGAITPRPKNPKPTRAARGHAPWRRSLRYHVARKELRRRLRLTPRRTADISTEQ
jgi:hypothetical protein